MGDLRGGLVGSALYSFVLRESMRELGGRTESERRFAEAMTRDLPLRGLVTNGGGRIDFAMLDGLLDMLNGHPLRGLGRLAAAALRKGRRVRPT